MIIIKILFCVLITIPVGYLGILLMRNLGQSVNAPQENSSVNRTSSSTKKKTFSYSNEYKSRIHNSDRKKNR